MRDRETERVRVRECERDREREREQPALNRDANFWLSGQFCRFYFSFSECFLPYMSFRLKTDVSKWSFLTRAQPEG